MSSCDFASRCAFAFFKLSDRAFLNLGQARNARVNDVRKTTGSPTPMTILV